MVDVLRHGTVEVWVPRSTRRTYQLGTLLPRSVAEGSARATKVDRLVAEADVAARRDYELRAARSEPALASAPETPQLPTQAS